MNIKPQSVVGYQYVAITPCEQGYTARGGQGGKIYDHWEGVLNAVPSVGFSTDSLDPLNLDDNDAVGVLLKDVLANMRPSRKLPHVVVSVLQQQIGQKERVFAFGVDRVKCYALEDGEFVSVADYDAEPECYRLSYSLDDILGSGAEVEA